MTRHITDTSKFRTEGARLRRFLKLDLTEGRTEAHPVLARAARTRDADRKLKVFARLDRTGGETLGR